MQSNYNPIKLVALMAIITGLYAFSNERSADKRPSSGIDIEFVGDQNLYITQGAVNKLLIQKFGALENVPKENLALNTIEKTIQANKMVKSAQVYLTVNGRLGDENRSAQAHRTRRGRLHLLFGRRRQARMPLSSSHSARVPIITGEITGKGTRGCLHYFELYQHRRVFTQECHRNPH